LVVVALVLEVQVKEVLLVVILYFLQLHQQAVVVEVQETLALVVVVLVALEVALDIMEVIQVLEVLVQEAQYKGTMVALLLLITAVVLEVLVTMLQPQELV
jgi:hypothetical protein